MEKKKPFPKALKVILKTVLGIVIAVVVLAVLALGALTALEYRPKDVEKVEAPNGSTALETGREFTIMSYNTGYAGLGASEEFFMDGGNKTRADNKETVEGFMHGIAEELKAQNADIYILQEVDTGSKRSYFIDETAYYKEALGLPFDFAYNFNTFYLPYPIPDTMGKVKSGLATYTSYAVDSAERIQLPVPFSWPMRTMNLKRCLLINRLPVSGTDNELVLINLHLEAYDSGEGKIAQTKMLYDVITSEVAKGNYVIAGGDFNQTFPGAHLYEAVMDGLWMPGTLDDNLPEGFRFVFDEKEPTCRSLDRPYTGCENPQYYIIDGFIVSSNVNVTSLEVLDTGFANSDHRPLKLVFSLDGAE